MPKLPLSPEFRAIRDNDALTEDQKVEAVLDVLKAHSVATYGEAAAWPAPKSDDPLGSQHGDGTIYITRKDKDGHVRPVALEPEVSRGLLIRAFLHPDEE